MMEDLSINIYQTPFINAENMETEAWEMNKAFNEINAEYEKLVMNDTTVHRCFYKHLHQGLPFEQALKLNIITQSKIIKQLQDDILAEILARGPKPMGHI